MPVDPPRAPAVVDPRGPVGRALLAAGASAELAGAPAAVVLAADDTPGPSTPGAVRRALDAVDAAGIGRVVVVTSGLVFGAWPTNPTPLGDDAAVRPNPDYEPAVVLGEVERLVADWADAHPAASVLVLRVAPVVEGWLAPLLAGAPTQQGIRADDVAAAVLHAAVADLAGAANLAPAGALDRPTAPPTLTDRLAVLRRHVGHAPTGDGLDPWTVHPPVLAGERLAATGWTAPAPTRLPEPPVASNDRGPLAAAVVAAGLALLLVRLRRSARRG